MTLLPETFVEYGTGLTWRLDLWYVVSDSGSAYFDEGFPSAKAAEAKTLAHYPATEVSTWRPENPANGLEDATEANVVLGRDMYLFQQANPL